MKTISINTDSGTSRLLIGESFANLHKYLPPGKTIIITDDKIREIYGRQFSSMPVISIGLGEQHKTFQTLERIFEQLIEFEADRSTFIVAIGGGIVCDVAGFAASIYMRGLRYGFVSTTLLSQVDASVGGKNGVNFRGYKNMIGVFNQPEFVIADIQMLDTLEEKEFRSGFAEIVKAAAIRSEVLFKYLEDNSLAALNKDPAVLEHLIYEAVKIKAQVVELDEKESGERKKLNFGHTFAHSIEHNTGMLHGEAVSIGMALAASLSVELNLLPKPDYDRLVGLLTSLRLPVELSLDYSKMVASMRKDKKRQGDDIHMIFIDRIGNALIKKISIKQLENNKYDLR
jgi:3-dehydroquinate synthase